MSTPPVSFNSLASSLIFNVNIFRNRPGILNKVVAGGCYPSIAIVGLTESVFAATCCAGSLILCSGSHIPFERSAKWLKSSSFCVIWSVADCILNPFVTFLVADEKSARQIAASGNILQYPHDAIT